MPHISVLIPVYNGVEFLDECLRSLCAQTYHDWEAWVGINGHTPESSVVQQIEDVVQKQKEPRIKIEKQWTAKSKIESLVLLKEQAQGEWFCILDCDDKWEPTKLERQVWYKNTINGPAKHAGVIGTHTYYFGERGGAFTTFSGFISSIVLEQVNPIVNSSVMFHRSLASWRYPLTALGNHMEDYDQWLRASLSGIILYVIPELLCWHRIHSNSFFNTKPQDPTPMQQAFRDARLKTACWNDDAQQEAFRLQKMLFTTNPTIKPEAAALAVLAEMASTNKTKREPLCFFSGIFGSQSQLAWCLHFLVQQGWVLQQFDSLCVLTPKENEKEKEKQVMACLRLATIFSEGVPKFFEETLAEPMWKEAFLHCVKATEILLNENNEANYQRWHLLGRIAYYAGEREIGKNAVKKAILLRNELIDYQNLAFYVQE